MENAGKTDARYALITEAPGSKATSEQIERLYQRYCFARQFCAGKDVLEAACGTGIGLRYLAEKARSVIGIDIDEKNIEIARSLCRGADKVRVELMDAQEIRLADGAVDTVLLFEALYYLTDPGRFIAEAHRVLKPGGVLIICTVNRNWDDFHPSPFSHAYFSVPELSGLIRQRFDPAALYGGFPVGRKGAKDRAISLIKRLATKFDLIPGSLKARAFLKRIFIGKLSPLPDILSDGMVPYREPAEILSDRICADFKIIYALAHKR